MNITLTNIQSFNNTAYGINVEGSATTIAENVVISSCTTKENNRGYSLYRTASSEIVNSISVNEEVGIDLFYVNNSLVQGNIINNPTSRGILIRGTNSGYNLISSNEIFDNRASPSMLFGVLLEDTAHDNTIINNVIRWKYSQGASDALALKNAGSSVTNYVFGNQCFNATVICWRSENGDMEGASNGTQIAHGLFSLPDYICLTMNAKGELWYAISSTYITVYMSITGSHEVSWYAKRNYI